MTRLSPANRIVPSFTALVLWCPRFKTGLSPLPCWHRRLEFQELLHRGRAAALPGDTHLQHCLEGSSTLWPRCSIEVLVVDNGSPDDTAEVIEPRFPHAKLKRSEEDLVFAKAPTVASKQSQGAISAW